MKTKKIGFYLAATHLGGAERSILDLATLLHSRSKGRYSPLLFLPKKDGLLETKISKLGLSVEILQLPSIVLSSSRKNGLLANTKLSLGLPKLISYSRSLIRSFRRNRLSLIHCNGLKPQLIAGATQSLHKLPVIWHLRDMIQSGPYLHVLNLLAQNKEIFAIANSQATASTLTKIGQHMRVVHNGLSPDQYRIERHREFNRQLGVSDNTPCIGFVAAFSRWKGPFEFLDMAAALNKQGLKAVFTMVGDEIYDTNSEIGIAEQLKQRAKQLSIDNKVLFTGFLPDPCHALNGFDLLVHCSIQPEPFGRIVLEAMSLALPIIASNDGGIPEMIEHGVHGLLYPPGNVSTLAERVKEVINNPERTNEMADLARKRFLNEFTLEKHVDRVIEFYDEILD